MTVALGSTESHCSNEGIEECIILPTYLELRIKKKSKKYLIIITGSSNCYMLDMGGVFRIFLMNKEVKDKIKLR